MGDKHLVRFEPVGIEIEVDEDQTILRAAAEQGVQLMHGCKEGQCAACKSFVLEGEDIELDSYSTFALPDFERDEGSTLLCRAHAYEDLVIELLNYDEEIIRSGLPLRKGTVEVVANEPVTHDLRHLVVKLIEPEEIKFFPGQYMDFQVPGHRGDPVVLDGEHAEPGRPVRVRHQDLPRRAVLGVPGREGAARRPAEVEAPFGTFTLRESRTSDLLFLGGGAGMAPMLGLLRSMAERGVDRKVTFYYGARTQQDLCFMGSSRSWPSGCPTSPTSPRCPSPGRRRLGGGEGNDHRRRQTPGDATRRGGRLRLRSAPDGRRGHRDADRAGSQREQHLLRQVHHHR